MVRRPASCRASGSRRCCRRSPPQLPERSREASRVGSSAAPIGGVPVVQRGAILGPRGAVVWTFESVAVVDWAPAGVERLVGGGGTNVSGEALFDRTELGAVLLTFSQRHGVRQPCEIW